VAAPTIDTARHPIILVTFSGYVSEPEFDAYLASMTKVISRPEKTVTIYDARYAIRNPASQRRKQADWLKQHEEQLRQYSLGTAFVITSPFVRGVLTAILWLQPMVSDYVVVGRMDEAEAWAAKKLRAAGLDVPPALARAPITNGAVPSTPAPGSRPQS
jgi:hypothetical protein